MSLGALLAITIKGAAFGRCFRRGVNLDHAAVAARTVTSEGRGAPKPNVAAYGSAALQWTARLRSARFRSRSCARSSLGDNRLTAPKHVRRSWARASDQSAMRSNRRNMIAGWPTGGQVGSGRVLRVPPRVTRPSMWQTGSTGGRGPATGADPGLRRARQPVEPKVIPPRRYDHPRFTNLRSKRERGLP